jgi:hypothetical protein
MKRIILIKDSQDILGSDGLMLIDGRFSMESIRNQVKDRNKRYSKNFPHLVCDSFYFAGEHLKQISKIYKLC